jgi:alanine dehydrogenase
MVIGIPKEIKDNEFRVAIVPSGVRALREGRHRVIIEEGAGAGSGITDEEFKDAGAELFPTPDDIYGRSDMVLKVKEPVNQEFKFLRDRLILFAFLHLAANKLLAATLIRSGGTSVAYETVEEDSGRLPILAPMSEIAGKIAVQAGAHHIMKSNGGEGVLLGGVPGTERGHVVIIGAGSVGLNALKIAHGLGARVTVINTSVNKLRYIDDIYSGQIDTLASNSFNIEKAVTSCDLLIGAVHFPGARTVKLVTKEMVSKMKKGSVIVDVSVDQGGCVETIRATSLVL